MDDQRPRTRSLSHPVRIRRAVMTRNGRHSAYHFAEHGSKVVVGCYVELELELNSYV